MVFGPIDVLVAGIGNVFLGDDGFGSAVVDRLRARQLPPGVRVVDFGIRAFDLALALARSHAAILIDAVRRDGPPGTLYVLEPDFSPARGMPIDGHELTAAAALRQLAPSDRPNLVRVVGCEPESFGPEGIGRLGLSAPVEAALDGACELVGRLLQEAAAGAIADA